MSTVSQGQDQQKPLISKFPAFLEKAVPNPQPCSAGFFRPPSLNSHGTPISPSISCLPCIIGGILPTQQGC